MRTLVWQSRRFWGNFRYISPLTGGLPRRCAPRNDVVIYTRKQQFCATWISSFLLSNILSCLFTEGFSNLTQGSTLWINDLIMQLNAPHNATTPIHSILEKYPYSQPYICKVFKHYTGTTPVKYFNDARLSQAYILIKSSASSISNIAEQTGFYHRSFFYKIFKEKYGITPSDVKKGIKPIAMN